MRSARGHIGGEVRQRPVCHRRHRRHPEKDGGALSDAEKPAPSLYEAKYRVGLAPHLEPDLEREAEQEAHLLLRVLFRASPDGLERFLRKVKANEPDFVDIMTDVVKRLTERGGESCAYLLPKEHERSRAVPATRTSPSNHGRNYEQHQE